METTGDYRVYMGLYWDSGKYNGKYYSIENVQSDLGRRP